MSLLELEQIEVCGDSASIGEAIGEGLREDIAAMIDRRRTAAAAYFSERGGRDTGVMMDAGRACLEAVETWDPDGWLEHMGTSRGACVDPVELFVAANYSDMRDVALLQPGDDGCTSIALPASRTKPGSVLVGQTWDLHPLDVDSVVAVHRRPTRGPETWSVTVAGAPTLIGMNEHGVWVGTTNIKVRPARVGIPYMSLLHRAIRCTDREAAASVVQHAPRAAAHTYLLADAGGAIELACSAETTIRRDLVDEPLVRTNHCLSEALRCREAESPGTSTLARFARALGSTDRRDFDVASVKELMRDRRDGVDSICRWAEDGESTATNACVIGVPAGRQLLACRGPADRGQWISLPFGVAT